jgi:hypothetical protein
MITVIVAPYTTWIESEYDWAIARWPHGLARFALGGDGEWGYKSENGEIGRGHGWVNVRDIAML